MDIYTQRSNWKLVLGFLAVVILAITIFYSNFLANELADSEKKNSSIYVQSLKEIRDEVDLNQDITFFQAILDSFDLPSIMIAEDGFMDGKNWSPAQDTDQVFLQKKVDNFESLGGVSLEGPGGYAEKIIIFNSKTLTYIRYFPIVQIILISLFVLFAYFLFNASRRAEQNRVWAGMAKETAHQLGTPIRAIIAWIEHLKLNDENHPDQLEIIDELNRDVNRLELVADRFSKIGSAPALAKVDIYAEMQKCKDYMAKRSPRNVTFSFQTSDEPLYVMINRHLFDWVIENLLRNALDAMDGRGKISATINQSDNMVVIDISDTGKGIPSAKFHSVFKPGYSTKQRGWGLGLSLAKRIIENYHKGKIFVKTSKINEGSTFTIKLPLA